jgi:hypothetical protein
MQRAEFVLLVVYWVNCKQLLQEFIDSRFNITSIILKGFNGALPVTTGKIHNTINVFRLGLRLLGLRLPRHATPETSTIQLLSKESF